VVGAVPLPIVVVRGGSPLQHRCRLWGAVPLSTVVVVIVIVHGGAQWEVAVVVRRRWWCIKMGWGTPIHPICIRSFAPVWGTVWVFEPCMASVVSAKEKRKKRSQILKGKKINGGECTLPPCAIIVIVAAAAAVAVAAVKAIVVVVGEGDGR
jgi:hypothetical protein